MPLIEVVEDPGRFEIPLKVDVTPESVLAKVAPHGHIVVCPNRVLHPNAHADADILDMARYTGVVLDKKRDAKAGRYSIHGAGLAWWLDKAVLFLNTDYDTATTVDEILALIVNGGILPPAIEPGTITTTGVGTWPGGNFEEAETSLSALRTVAASMQLSWHVKPNGTLDACLKTRDEVFKTTLSAITHVLTPEAWGDDPLLKGVEATKFVTRYDATNYVTRVVLIGEQFDGSNQIIDFQNRDSIPEKDLHGNEAVINVAVSQPPTDTTISTDAYFDDMLDEWNTDLSIEFEALQWELGNGTVKVGDHIGVWAPPSIVDDTNKRWHRGRYMGLKLLPVSEFETKLRRGMDVLYRDKDAVYTVLTPYVDWEF
jgi:hypothetical protein